ncbi:MAG: 4Fe-4S dicluster domain-containing protein [Dehalococcoidia bacterium]|nr:MAG: 4Fe-4S dicluster domain-containing protein [Dehalococcoidia bacterium]
MYKIEVHRPWCKKCGICIAFCPKQNLEPGEMSYPTAKDPEKCNGCKLCELRCPDFAMYVYEDEESLDESSIASRE